MTISEEQIKSAGDLIDKIISQEEELKEAFASAYQGDFIVGEIVKELKHMRADSANSEENEKRAKRIADLSTVLQINTVVKSDFATILPLLVLPSMLPSVIPLDDEKQ